MNVETIRLWASLLRELPQARILLKTLALADETVRKRYQKMFASEGVVPARVELQGPSGHNGLLACYGEVDIALDPFPYSGGLTTCEALWMGVPVVTLAGERFAGRHATSHLYTVGLPDLTAQTPEQYLAIACELAQDVSKLADLRAGLRTRMAASALCDGKRFSGNFTRALRQMWRGWCSAA